MIRSHAQEQSEETLARRMIGLAMKVHRELGHGFLEKLYQNALVYELEQAGIPLTTEQPFPVYYEDRLIGDFYADLVIDDTLIVELKAVSALTKDHSLQLVNYLNAARLDEGLLINFGAPQLEFKTKTRHYQKATPKSEMSFR